MAFESAISTIISEGTLSKEQKIAFYEMYNTPWCIFHDDHTQDSWHPQKDIAYLSGVPLSIGAGYVKEDTCSILKKKLSSWTGKPQKITVQFTRWHESKILAVFDLRTWFEIQKIDYKKIDLHKIIWPKGRVSESTGLETNPNDDIEHCLDLAKRVINKSPISSLLKLCNGRRYKNEKTRV